MTAVAEAMAQPLAVQSDSRVETVRRDGRSWIIATTVTG